MFVGFGGQVIDQSMFLFSKQTRIMYYSKMWTSETGWALYFDRFGIRRFWKKNLVQDNHHSIVRQMCCDNLRAEETFLYFAFVNTPFDK
mmetsp:Transcript_30625/g.70564  ORF Transcript_30625/g.70564 Transcript_30625/m.70564 type:complete len:89 (+) Transcript_30625:641-907(+)